MLKNIPSVEDQLFVAQRALALGMMTVRAVGQSKDLYLTREDEEDAFLHLSNMLQDGMKACRAIAKALPASASNLDAPEVR